MVHRSKFKGGGANQQNRSVLFSITIFCLFLQNRYRKGGGGIKKFKFLNRKSVLPISIGVDIINDKTGCEN